MGAARSYLKNRTMIRLAAAVSALALLGACELGPTPEEIMQMDWSQAARVDTPPAYAEYIRMHPDGLNVVPAQRRIDELVAMESAGYATAKKVDTEEGYETFLTRFPWGAHSAEADGRRAVLAAPRLAALEKSEWEQAKAADSIERFEVFIRDWPRGAHFVDARGRLDALWKTDQGAFVRAKRSSSPVELDEFLRAYPRSKYAADARIEIDAIYRRDDEGWRRALADNSVSAYDFYLQSQPWGRWLLAGYTGLLNVSNGATLASQPAGSQRPQGFATLG